MIIEKISPEVATELCRKITADLPEYFGLPDANESYAQGVKSCINFAAKLNGEYVGLLSLDFPYPNNASIYWMGVLSTYHRKGVGQWLVLESKAFAVEQGAQSITVETVSKKTGDKYYSKTHDFYESLGFMPMFDLKPEGYECTMVYMVKKLQYNANNMPSAEELFETASYHFFAAECLLKPCDQAKSQPFTFFSAGFLLHLSLEIFLKGCIKAYGIQPRATHDLKKLVKNLSEIMAERGNELAFSSEEISIIKHFQKCHDMRYNPGKDSIGTIDSERCAKVIIRIKSVLSSDIDKMFKANWDWNPIIDTKKGMEYAFFRTDSQEVQDAIKKLSK